MLDVEAVEALDSGGMPFSFLDPIRYVRDGDGNIASRLGAVVVFIIILLVVVLSLVFVFNSERKRLLLLSGVCEKRTPQC